MPAIETPRPTHISSADETERVPEEVEGATSVNAENEATAEEPSEGTAPGKD